MSDLPYGEWSGIIVGHQWPAHVSLAALSASAERRHATVTAHNDYADSLRSIRTNVLGGQQGITAESAHHAFHAGESTALQIASRNAAKRDAYRAAHRQVAELRSALAEIAETGNAEIAGIRQSGLPLPEKVSAIVRVVVAGQSQANARAAACSAGLFDAIQAVLTSAGSPVSAREFTGHRGVELHEAFRSPHPDQVRHHVERVLDPSAPPVPHVPDEAPPPTRERVFAASAPGAVQLPPQRSTLPEPTAPVASATSATSAPDAPPAVVPAAVAPSAPARPTSAPTRLGAVPAAPPAGRLPSYGADLRPTSAPSAPSYAAPVSAAVNPAGPLSTPPVVRQPFVVAKAGFVARLTERATVPRPTASPLQRLLDAVARQQPEIGWAIGGRPGGRILLVSSIGGGWVPPGIAIPAGVSLPAPSGSVPSDDMAQMLIHTPGQPVSPPDEAGEPPVSVDARDVAPVADLGWELSLATRWRDGLPRLAHTVVRAAVESTGLAESELQLLRTELQTVKDRVLADYPDAFDPADLANWQLLAAVEALADDEIALTHYHFAWFRTGI